MKKILLTMVALMATMFVASAQTNLIANGDFETWAEGQPVNWKSTNSASNAVLEQSKEAHAGSYSVLVKGATKNKRLGSKELNLKAGDYSLKFYTKAATAEGGSACPGYVLPNADGTLNGDSYKYGDYVNDLTQTSWIEVKYDFTLSAASTINIVVMNGRKPGKDILVDDLTLTTTNGGLNEGGEVNPEPQPEPEAVIYTSISDLKKNAVQDAAPVVYEFTDLLVTGKAGNDIFVSDGQEATYFYGSANTLNVGDKISGKVKADLVSYWGLTELKNVDYTEVKVVSSGNEVKPMVVTLSELAAEGSFVKYESMLVVVKGVKVGAAAFANKNITMTDGANEITLRDNYDSAADYKFDTATSYDFVGVINQFKGKTQINLLNAEGIQISTGIEAVEAENGAQVIYDLSGRRVAKAVKGLYIINGKKVYVK